MSWVQNAIRWLLPDEGPFYELIGAAGEAAHSGAVLLQEGKYEEAISALHRLGAVPPREWQELPRIVPVLRSEGYMPDTRPSDDKYRLLANSKLLPRLSGEWSTRYWRGCKQAARYSWAAQAALPISCVFLSTARSIVLRREAARSKTDRLHAEFKFAAGGGK